MTISSIILTLGLQIIFSENIKADCHTKFNTGGCYRGDYIVLNYQSPDLDGTLYHEVGHALFLKDKEVKEFISKYPAPRFYHEYQYPTEDKRLDEKVSDYFLMYMKYSDFGEKFPEVKELFDLKLSQINK